MLDFDERFPSEPDGVLDDLDLGCRGTIEDDIQPEILPEPLDRPVFITGESYLSNSGPAFDFNEPHCNRRVRVFRIRPPRNQIDPRFSDSTLVTVQPRAGS